MVFPPLLLLLLSLRTMALADRVLPFPIFSRSISASEPSKKAASPLAKPLIGDDRRVYICSEKNFFAFENNGSIAWTINLNYTCNTNIAPVQGGSSKIYLVAENRVLKVNPFNVGTSESAVEEFFGPEPEEIIGLDVSVSSSCVIINVRNRGLFAYRLYGQMIWSAGPLIYQHGYRQGCKNNVTDCSFSSSPVIDHCEASIYVSNNQGELYSLSVRSPHFKWIQDLSSYGTRFRVTPANNGLLYVTMPAQALLLALDVSTGQILWQGSFGPLFSEDYAPIVDSNGWISLGSLDGFLYSFSPTGFCKKFPESVSPDFVIQVSPLIDCSGYGVYVSQTEMDGKVGHTLGNHTYMSALKPKRVLFVMIIPATGAVYWSESYPPGQFSQNLSLSDLQHFKLDESTLLAFMVSSSIGSPFSCRSTRQKLASSCSQTSAKYISIYTGNEKTILLFLLFETTVLITLAALVRFCCIFWKKNKLQIHGLGKFLEKRHSLRLQKKAFDRTITELEQKSAEEAVANEVLEKLGVLVKEREGIQRKLSTSYSLGRDGAGLRPKSSLLPLYNGKRRSYSFQGARKESVTIFHTYSDTSSSDGSSENATDEDTQDEETELSDKAKGKAPIEFYSSTDEEFHETQFQSFQTSPSPSSISGSSSKCYENPLFIEHPSHEIVEAGKVDEGQMQEFAETGSRSIRRRTLPSTD
ncbi:OLC1v1009937C1 [Oldenlandia corymbosa var. corymbosa]|uniref:OLC1v1009937C1 n=1 Tax=Oldenlandia corymbosa var. corymbosa TaxID=529605 RepID=A0AAV1DSH1_OLDCO|nr:OLC1v1009937C1 [Oldenlandia corymbosa var. corymbosa]